MLVLCSYVLAERVTVLPDLPGCLIVLLLRCRHVHVFVNITGVVSVCDITVYLSPAVVLPAQVIRSLTLVLVDNGVRHLLESALQLPNRLRASGVLWRPRMFTI